MVACICVAFKVYLFIMFSCAACMGYISLECVLCVHTYEHVFVLLVLGILVGLVLLSCAGAGSITQINLGEWMKLEEWVMVGGRACRRRNTE